MLLETNFFFQLIFINLFYFINLILCQKLNIFQITLYYKSETTNLPLFLLFSQLTLLLVCF